MVIANIVACDDVATGRGETDADPVVSDSVACNGVIVAGRGEADAAIVVGGIVACNDVVAGIGEFYAVPVVTEGIV